MWYLNTDWGTEQSRSVQNQVWSQQKLPVSSCCLGEKDLKIKLQAAMTGPWLQQVPAGFRVWIQEAYFLYVWTWHNKYGMSTWNLMQGLHLFYLVEPILKDFGLSTETCFVALATRFSEKSLLSEHLIASTDKTDRIWPRSLWKHIG